MKIHQILTSAVFALLVCPSLRAQTPVAGTQLEIGASGSNQVYNSSSFYSGAIGSNNTVNATHALAVGQSNVLGVNGGGYYSAAFGYGNTIQIEGYSFAAGQNNTNYGSISATFGAWHQIAFDPDWGSARAAFLCGESNYNDMSNASFLSGLNNVALWSKGTATMGRGLINSWDYATIVGSYNDSTITDALRFAVGNGSDANNRSNAFEVYADGRIRMPRQGDVGMGRFGYTADQ